MAFATVDAVAEKDLAERYVPSGHYPQLMWPPNCTGDIENMLA